MNITLHIEGTDWGVVWNASSTREAKKALERTTKYKHSGRFDLLIAKYMTEIMQEAETEEKKRRLLLHLKGGKV